MQKNLDPGPQIAVLRIRDVYPGFCSFTIPDLEPTTKKWKGKKLVVLPFLFCSHPQISQNYNYFSFEQTQKKM
jgi:hypothetical protein